MAADADDPDADTTSKRRSVVGVIVADGDAIGTQLAETIGTRLIARTMRREARSMYCAGPMERMAPLLSSS